MILRKISRKSRIYGNPWKSKSPQSIGCIPIAPPITHFILPNMCGSGMKGASPSVRHNIKTVDQLLMISFIKIVTWLSRISRTDVTRNSDDLWLIFFKQIDNPPQKLAIKASVARPKLSHRRVVLV